MYNTLLHVITCMCHVYAIVWTNKHGAVNTVNVRHKMTAYTLVTAYIRGWTTGVK